MKIRDELAKENATQEKKTGRSSIRLGSIELRPVFFSRLLNKAVSGGGVHCP
jgi:hypothetical protein